MINMEGSSPQIQTKDNPEIYVSFVIYSKGSAGVSCDLLIHFCFQAKGIDFCSCEIQSLVSGLIIQLQNMVQRSVFPRVAMFFN